ncbi:hypothetical protein [Actinoplanes sp. URMC 104]|uniref:hypothetical protein n=1 Tax=Actinoplanes sp. URMC 104 TaxID=3423409 RepID=UPI003F1B6F66
MTDDKDRQRDDNTDVVALAGKVRAVLELAGFGPAMVGPFDTHPGVEVQIDDSPRSEPTLWVRWRPSRDLEQAVVEKYRQAAAGDPVVEFNHAMTTRMGQTLADILALAGFDVQLGVNDYAHDDILVSGCGDSAVLDLATASRGVL